MAERPSMKDGLSELFRRTNDSVRPADPLAAGEPVKGQIGRAHV